MKTREKIEAINSIQKDDIRVATVLNTRRARIVVYIM